jgi:hypothetical protein
VMNARKSYNQTSPVITARLEARRPLMKVVVGDGVWLDNCHPCPVQKSGFPNSRSCLCRCMPYPLPPGGHPVEKIKTQGVHRKTMLGPLRLMMHRRVSSPSPGSLQCWRSCCWLVAATKVGVCLSLVLDRRPLVSRRGSADALLCHFVSFCLFVCFYF